MKILVANVSHYDYDSHPNCRKAPMYVCICKNVTEKDIKRAIGDGAYSFDCLQERLEVSTCCGQCEPTVADCLEKSLDAVFPAEFALTA